jgi:pyruvate dehydrogenase E2 component (dihydrolipoamide acetyltransferase)
VVDGVVAPRTVTTLGVSIDHRVVDGEQGAGFLRNVADLLAEPLRLLLTDDRESLP